MTPPSPQPNTGGEGDLGRLFWGLVVLTGVAAGLGAGALMALLRAVQGIAWHEGEAGFARAVDASAWGHRVAVLAGAGLVVASGGWLLRHARGRHAGELVSTLWFHAGRLPFLPSIAQACLSMTIVGLGAAVGRESAPKQAGAAFGSLFAERAGLSSGHVRLLAAFGAGAGMAAVYNVPLGAGLFAVEVLIGSLHLSLAVPALLTSGIATGVSWLLLPDEPTYLVHVDRTTPSMLVFALLMGPLAGLASAAYVRLLAFADRRRPKGVGAVVAPILVFIALGLGAIPLPELLGNGKDTAQAAFTGALAWPVLLAVALFKPIATASCLGSGAPGGLFTPTVTLGATLGGTLGAAWLMIWPGDPPGAYALVTAAAVLAGTTQGPISALALMLELTHTLDTLMVPMLIAVAGAMTVVRFIEPRSVYAYRIHDARKKAEDEPGPSISAAARYVELLRALPEPGAPPLRVVDDKGSVVGVISADRVRHPRPEDGPLTAACAVDFVVGAPGRGA